MIIKVICSWCREEIKLDNSKEKYSYGIKHCPKCFASIRSSTKESTGSLSGRKHIHLSLKTGDVV